MVVGIILSIVFCIIVFFILEFVIKSAIDNSQTAENIREIRMILNKKSPEIDKDEENPLEDSYETEDLHTDQND